jgi:hypothetical protein
MGNFLGTLLLTAMTGRDRGASQFTSFAKPLQTSTLRSGAEFELPDAAAFASALTNFALCSFGATEFDARRNLGVLDARRSASDEAESTPPS